MLNAVRWIALCAALLPVLAVVVLVSLAFYSLEEAPLVPRNAPADYATVAAGKALAKRIKIQVEAAEGHATMLAVTEKELDQLAQLGSHTFAWLNTDIEFDRAAIHTMASVHLPTNPFGEYLNMDVRVNQSSAGVAIDRVSIGPLQFSGRWLLPLAARLLDVLLPNEQASTLLASVREFRIDGETALLNVVPPADVKVQLKQAVRTLQAARFPSGEGERVGHYYDLLVALGSSVDARNESLNTYLTPLMVEAADRGANSSATTENRAAIWALVIYFSNGAFETLVGKLVSAQRSLVRAPSEVTLAGREDLMAHFLYSAGSMLATLQGIGIAAGEFKELLDSGDGGSGFSFADLAADRAGIAFVTAATASEEQAQQLQKSIIASNAEAAFFPDVSGLIEGLSEEQFRQGYGNAKSQRYRAQVEQIDSRIVRLPVYGNSIAP